MVNDSSSMRRWLALAGVVMVAALTTACAENRKPPVAAMVPQSTNGVFGYADKMVAPALYEDAYVSPPLRATPAADDAHGLAGAPPSWRRRRSLRPSRSSMKAATST